MRLYPDGVIEDHMSDAEAHRRLSILNSGSFTPGGVNILGLLNLAVEALQPDKLWHAIQQVGESLNNLDIIEPSIVTGKLPL